MTYRHAWTVPLAAIIEPFLYLLSIGVGVGALIGTVPGVDVRYPVFVAPALLATAAMNTAFNRHELRRVQPASNWKTPTTRS